MTTSIAYTRMVNTVRILHTKIQTLVMLRNKFEAETENSECENVLIRGILVSQSHNLGIVTPECSGSVNQRHFTRVIPGYTTAAQ